MRPRARLFTALLATLLAAAPAIAGERWLHIRVVEAKDEQTVRINLPLSLLDSVAPLLEEANLGDTKIKVGSATWDRSELKAFWEEVRRAGDGDYVTVDSNREKVRIAKNGEILTIHVREQGERSEKVDITLPMAVVEALLSGPGEDLNIAAAVRALGSHGDGELVAVDDETSVVRIWIDGKNGD